jgi:hypothetical protein
MKKKRIQSTLELVGAGNACGAFRNVGGGGVGADGG